jgi:hypothetical protein
MMSIKSKKELLVTVGPRYRAARGKDQECILDEFVAVTGYHRKYAIRVLNHPAVKRQSRKRRRARQYGLKVELALLGIWKVANRIAAKRLVPCLDEFVDALERHGELQLDPETRSLLLKMSVATADRLLHPHRQRLGGRGLGTTKPGTLLKKNIPIRTFADWDDVRPGFLEMDTVAHCADSTRGEYLHSLVLTDIATAWTEYLALLNRSQRHVFKALVAARQRLPFPLLGLDSDNGPEFINGNLLRYCQQEQITFTRSREYKKNDQAHVEQKNWVIVRQLVGYERYEGEAAFQELDALYQVVRLYVNFFQPVQKLVAKERIDAKVRKRYDTAKTPCQRVLKSEHVNPESKELLHKQYLSLNPAELLRQIEHLQYGLWRFGQSYIPK